MRELPRANPPTVHLTSFVTDSLTAVHAAAEPGMPPRRPVLFVHGMFGGAWLWERYQGLFARHGYESWALNLRGHHDSRPVAALGQVRFVDYAGDVVEAARAIRTAPIVVGHSMGGLLAQKAAEAGVAGAAVLIASAPPRGIALSGPRLIVKQLKYLPAMLRSRPLVPEEADTIDVVFNRTPPEQRVADFARLVPESGRVGLEISLGLGATVVNRARVRCPMLVVTGRDDHFVVPRVARQIASRYTAPLREYDGFAHHIIIEPGWERVGAEIIGWLNATVPAP